VMASNLAPMLVRASKLMMASNLRSHKQYWSQVRSHHQYWSQVRSHH
jgi:hypothetical protein